MKTMKPFGILSVHAEVDLARLHIDQTSPYHAYLAQRPDEMA